MQGAALVQAVDEGIGKGRKALAPAAEGGRVEGFAVHAQQRHALRGKIPLRRVQQCVDQLVAAVFRTSVRRADVQGGGVLIQKGFPARMHGQMCHRLISVKGRIDRKMFLVHFAQIALRCLKRFGHIHRACAHVPVQRVFQRGDAGQFMLFRAAHGVGQRALLGHFHAADQVAAERRSR